MRKRNATVRPSEISSAHTIQKILRDSPRLRHRLHLNADYLPRTPPLAASNLTSDHLPKKYRQQHHHHLATNLLMPLCKKKESYGEMHANDTFVELPEVGHESARLLYESPPTTTFSNGTNTNGVMNGGPRPV